VNPAHLFLGSDADNMADKAAKGRAVGPRLCGDANPLRRHPESVLRGEAHPGAKLTAAQVVEIRKLYSQGTRIVALVARFGINRETMRHIIQRRLWRSVP
jgi:hypothetical protein